MINEIPQWHGPRTVIPGYIISWNGCVWSLLPRRSTYCWGHNKMHCRNHGSYSKQAVRIPEMRLLASNIGHEKWCVWRLVVLSTIHKWYCSTTADFITYKELTSIYMHKDLTLQHSSLITAKVSMCIVEVTTNRQNHNKLSEQLKWVYFGLKSFKKVKNLVSCCDRNNITIEI